MTDTPKRDLRNDLLHAIDFAYVTGVLGYGTPEELLTAYDTSRTQPTDQTALHRIAEAALSAVEAALGDTLVPAAREEALAGIAAVLPPPADRTTVLREAADALEGRHCSPESVDVVLRLIDERLCDACKGYGQTATPTEDGGIVRRCRDCDGKGLRRMTDETATTEETR